MRYIYSNKLIKELEGFYKNPQFFQAPEHDATEVYTDNLEIAKIYKERGVKVLDLKGKPFKFPKTPKKQDKGE